MAIENTGDAGVKQGLTHKTSRKPTYRDRALSHIITSPKRGLKFVPCSNFWLYLLLLAGALLFTQALRSPISAVLFVFMLLLPLFTLAYLFIASACVKVYVSNGQVQAQKLSPVKFGLKIANDSIIPIPFTEIDISLPVGRAMRCLGRRVRVSLAPFGCYDLSEEVTFPYRGKYEIGVSDIYIYDLFRMFRLRVDADTFTTVFVMPRRLTIGREGTHAPSDVNTSSVKNITGIDRAELSDIREYRSGDNMKSIHWKLSSKAQELVVKEYAMNSGNRVYIFADMAKIRNADNIYEDDINEYAADGVVELAIAAASRELQEGNDCTMIWYDGLRPGMMQSATLESAGDLESVLPLFSAAELCPSDESHDFTRLAVTVTETQGVTVIFVSARMDAPLVRGITAAASAFGALTARGAVGYIYFDPSERIKSPEALTAYRETAENCRRQLNEAGITVISPKI